MAENVNCRFDGAHYMTFPEFLPAEQVAELNAHCDRIEATEAKVCTPDGTGSEVMPRHRSANVAWLYRDDHELLPQIFDKLNAAVGYCNDRHYGLEIGQGSRDSKGKETLHYVEYLTSDTHPGHFDWHLDWSHRNANRYRKLTAVLQLSRPEDYLGCELRLFGGRELIAPNEAGTLIVFPSFFYHQATEIRKGRRRILIGWYRGTEQLR